MYTEFLFTTPKYYGLTCCKSCPEKIKIVAYEWVFLISFGKLIVLCGIIGCCMFYGWSLFCFFFLCVARFYFYTNIYFFKTLPHTSISFLSWAQFTNYNIAMFTCHTPRYGATICKLYKYLCRTGVEPAARNIENQSLYVNAPRHRFLK